MKEGFEENPGKTSVKDEGKKMVYDISEEDIISATQRVYKKTGIQVTKDVLIAIIKDIHEHRSQGKSFKEARSVSTKRWAGNYGKEYWSAISSAVGIIYSSKRKNKSETHTGEIPGKGYKDFY